MLRYSMRLRALSLALALLLLLTQQFGLQHMLSHALRAPAGASLASGSTPAPLSDDATGADSLCHVCLVLSAFGAASLPALLVWSARPPHRRLSASLPRQAPRLQAGTPYLARAPPTGLALT